MPSSTRVATIIDVASADVVELDVAIVRPDDPFAVMQAGLTARDAQRLLEEALDAVSALALAPLSPDLRVIARRLGDELHAAQVSTDLLDHLAVLHERTHLSRA